MDYQDYPPLINHITQTKKEIVSNKKSNVKKYIICTIILVILILIIVGIVRFTIY